MTKRARMLHGEWPRWSKYQFVEGRIAAAPGARLEWYDPWKHYEAGKERGDPPPYVELLNILRDFRPHTRQEYGYGEMGRILEWTRRNGLLGVLHKHLFWVASLDDLDWSTYAEFISVGPRLVERERRYDGDVEIRSYDGWVNYSPEKLRLTPRGAYANADNLGNDRFLGDQFLLPLPGIISEELKVRDGSENIMSDKFFAEYCEPIDLWFGDVFAFAEGVYEKGVGRFPIDLSRISLQFATVNGVVDLRHTYASLLDALALMYAQDQITGYRLVQCAGCGCDVVTTAYQALYCSRRCGDRDRKRKSRAAAAAKLEKVARARARRHRAPA